MSRIKFLAGSIAGGIIVAAIIVTLVTNSFTELTSEDVFKLVKEDMASKTGDPTKITKFSIKQRGNSMEFSITVDGKIPHDGKKLPVSDSAKAFGYAWLRLGGNFDVFHHTPNQLTGYMVSIKPGDAGFSPEGWWKIESVNIIQMDFDNPYFCMLYSQKTEGITSITENELKVDVILKPILPILPIDRAMVIAIEHDETCLDENGVHILDTKMN